VDALYIDQSDPDELALQVKSMASVYSRAYLTIVAVSSTSSDDGLPGVSFDRSTAEYQTSTIIHGKKLIISDIILLQSHSYVPCGTNEGGYYKRACSHTGVCVLPSLKSSYGAESTSSEKASQSLQNHSVCCQDTNNRAAQDRRCKSRLVDSGSSKGTPSWSTSTLTENFLSIRTYWRPSVARLLTSKPSLGPSFISGFLRIILWLPFYGKWNQGARRGSCSTA
jgi:hypothetical protein